MSPEKKRPAKPEAPSAKAAERLAVIVDAAEQAALTVIDDAEKEARRYLDEARARADQVAAERLREIADELERGDRAPAAAPESEEPLAEVPRLRAVDPPAAPRRASDEPGGESGGNSAAARLLATQMAVSGSSREEIELRLRNGFDIEDTGQILDAILGPEE